MPSGHLELTGDLTARSRKRECNDGVTRISRKKTIGLREFYENSLNRKTKVKR